MSEFQRKLAKMSEVKIYYVDLEYTSDLELEGDARMVMMGDYKDLEKRVKELEIDLSGVDALTIKDLRKEVEELKSKLDNAKSTLIEYDGLELQVEELKASLKSMSTSKMKLVKQLLNESK